MRALVMLAARGRRATEWRAMIGLAIVALAACDGGAPADAGPDAGRDAFVERPDANADAPEIDAGGVRALVRLAHLVPNVPDATGAGRVHVCLAPLASPNTQLLLTQDTAVTPPAPLPLPYGGISPYTDLLDLLPVTYRLRIYEAASVTGTSCPDPSLEIFHTDLDASGLVRGAHFTIAAIGLVGGTGAQAPQIVVVLDDVTEPAAGSTRVRLIHGLANYGMGAIDVCWDPDFAPPASPGPMPAVSLFADARYLGSLAPATLIPYVERAPIATGALFVAPRIGGPRDCATLSPAPPTIVIPIPFPVPPPGMVPPNVTATIDDGDVVTIFLRGDAAMGAMVMPISCTPPFGPECDAAGPSAVCHPIVRRCVHPQGPTITPWIDVL
jgi:hypothetical protein